MKHYRLFLLLIGLLVLAFLADIAIGSVSLSIRDVWNTFIGSNDNPYLPGNHLEPPTP